MRQMRHAEKDDQYVRSGMYGSFLSGGFAGHMYGVGRNLGRGHRAQRQVRTCGKRFNGTRPRR